MLTSSTVEERKARERERESGRGGEFPGGLKMNEPLRCNFNDIMNLEACRPTNPAQKKKKKRERERETGSTLPSAPTQAFQSQCNIIPTSLTIMFDLACLLSNEINNNNNNNDFEY